MALISYLFRHLFAAAVIQTALSQTTVHFDLLASLKTIAEYSAAAYCPGNYDQSTQNSSFCPEDVCPDLQKPNIGLEYAFNGTSRSDARAILAIDHDEQQITISFRGTVSDNDWQTNVDFILVDANEICSGCSVHTGFLISWRGTAKPIVESWKFALELYPNYNTSVTGHSLGGALATLCALELKRTNVTTAISLFTYGAPRIGDGTFATFVETTLREQMYRVTHLNDPVPRLPAKLLGFRHPYPEYHITAPHIPDVLKANESVLTAPDNLVVQPGDVLVLDRDQSDDGNGGYQCSNVAMHDGYFIDISKCATGNDTPLLGGIAKQICGVMDICC